MSWYGGFAGGVATGLFFLRRHRVPIVPVLAAAAPALALGHAIGRIGCFLVGDDYGVATDLPWAVAFPGGLPPTSVPVHPTQLYEAAALLLIMWLLLRWRRQRRSDNVILGAYLIATGSARFSIEFLRARESLFGPFALAHGAVACCCLHRHRPVVVSGLVEGTDRWVKPIDSVMVVKCGGPVTSH